jgi:2-iminobutanoate/2-iminopropanoate deaminase
MEVIQTPAAPAAIGPYSQGIVVGSVLYTAGQIPLDPDTMKIVEGGIEEQTVQVLKNLDAVLLEAKTSWNSVAKTTVYLTNLNDFAAFNSIYEQHLKNAKPARSTVQVAALPRGAVVEIELIAEITAK